MQTPSADIDPLIRLGEWFRRSAIGLTAALIVARAYWPGAYHDEAGTGLGLGWVAGLLVAAALGILSAFFGQRVRFRVSWTDLTVLALFVLVAISARQGAGVRVATNLAWEWVGVGLAYLLVRQLPRTAAESSALFASIAATAVALSAFGLYQVAVIQPETQRLYLADPEAALREAGVGNDPVTRRHFEDRLLGSKEPTSTFALTNSLAGYLVGPLVVCLALGLVRLRDPERRTGRWTAIALALPPILLMTVCLLLTKSRSAYIGLAVALCIVAWKGGRRAPARWIIGVGLGLLALLILMVAVGLASGHLDRLILTESTKSLRYRWEYWVSTWRLIWDGSSRWWLGIGPGNFGGLYPRYKLPQASESISDPHNLFLEVWATAGLPALLALLAAIGLGLRQLLGTEPTEEPEPTPTPDLASDPLGAPLPKRPGWLIVAAGLGGWLLAMVLQPDLSPLGGDLMRWVVLGGAWAWAVLMGLPLWSGAPLLPWALGAGLLAVLVNLLAAGGIGFATVALVVWVPLALGLNLRENRPSSRLRHWDGWLGSFVLAAIWAAIGGTFLGTVGPHWAAESALQRAEASMHEARHAFEQTMRRLPPNLPTSRRFEEAFQAAHPFYLQAESAYKEATQADRYASRPWMGRALLELEAWRAEGEPVRLDRLIWHRVNSALEQAVKSPRNPDNLSVQTLRAQLAEVILQRSGWPEFERRTILADRLDALRRASRLSPTDSRLTAELALALDDSGFSSEASQTARQALWLDASTPHLDKKLPEEIHRALQDRFPAQENSPTRSD